MDSIKSQRIFVYGTLREGLWNNVYMQGSEFERIIRVKGFSLYSYGIPYAVRAYDSEESIVVESYLVPIENMHAIDMLEEHPFAYKRIIVKDIEGNEGWLYTYPHNTGGASKIEGGDYISLWDSTTDSDIIS